MDQLVIRCMFSPHDTEWGYVWYEIRHGIVRSKNMHRSSSSKDSKIKSKYVRNEIGWNWMLSFVQNRGGGRFNETCFRPVGMLYVCILCMMCVLSGSGMSVHMCIWSCYVYMLYVICKVYVITVTLSTNKNNGQPLLFCLSIGSMVLNRS